MVTHWVTSLIQLLYFIYLDSRQCLPTHILDYHFSMTLAYLLHGWRPSNWVSGCGSPSCIRWLAVTVKRRSQQVPTGLLSRHVIIFIPWWPWRSVCSVNNRITFALWNSAQIKYTRHWMITSQFYKKVIRDVKRTSKDIYKFKIEFGFRVFVIWFVTCSQRCVFDKPHCP